MEDILSLTVVKLREYAKDNNISIKGLRLKKELQDAIIGSLKKGKSKPKIKDKEKAVVKTNYKSDDYIVEDEDEDTQETKHAKSITRFLYKMYKTTNILKEDPLFEKCGIGRYIYLNWESKINNINIKSILDGFRTILKKYKLKIPKTTKNAEIALLFMKEYKDDLETSPKEYKIIVDKLKSMIEK